MATLPLFQALDRWTLPEPEPEPTRFRASWSKTLEELAVSDVLAGRASFEVLYRAAVKRHHPDAGGDAALFRRLTEARNLLVRHHGGQA